MTAHDQGARLATPGEVGRGVRGEVPVEPDGPTARRWAEEELAEPIYHEQPSVLDRVVEWVVEQLERLSGAASGVDLRTALIVLGVLLLVAAVVALVVTGPVRRARAARGASAEVFGDDTRSTAELRASADRLAAEGRWAEAVLDRFRAVLRSLEDRALLDEQPGRTAHEATEQAAARLPACRADLVRAGRLFDDVCYGHQGASADDDAWLREVDQRVGVARPVSTEVAVPAGPERPR